MTAADRIRARIAELEGIRERYLAYQQDRVKEHDHHGAWDVAVNLSETECEMAGLRFALEAVEAERVDQDRCPRVLLEASGDHRRCVKPAAHASDCEWGPLRP